METAQEKKNEHKDTLINKNAVEQADIFFLYFCVFSCRHIREDYLFLLCMFVICVVPAVRFQLEYMHWYVVQEVSLLLLEMVKL